MAPKKEEKKAAAPAAAAAGGAAKTPAAPQTILAKRKRTERLQAHKAKATKALTVKRVTKRKTIFKRAETYVKEYRTAEADEVRLRRQAKQAGNFYVPAEAKLAFVVRIRGINGLSPKVRKVLQLLRLLQINNGVFVRLSKATINMLRIVEPYIAYGYPNLKTVKELIYKRGFAKVHRQRVSLTDNALIEQELGKQNIICIEDLVHELYTVGPNFKTANGFLWPFKLNNPTGGWTKKRKHFIEGGDYGNRENYINELVQRMI